MERTPEVVGQDEARRPGSGVPVLPVTRKPRKVLISRSEEGTSRRPGYQYFKGIANRFVAALLIVVLSPLLAFIAIAIRLDSPGNPMFVQERVGKNGRRFFLYKFRSMYVNHDDSKYKEFIKKYLQDNVSSRLDENGEDVYQLIKDPRVTRVGVLLRKTNLDELPQLFNILKGEMAFIGPRPDIPFAVEMYQERHLERLRATPGITGLWQVSGRKNLSFDDMVNLDLDYIRRQSPLLDAKILMLTIPTALGKHGS